jgi:hypothetical protein
VALSLPASAVAAPPPPSSLHVLDGEGWQADRSFSIGWTNPAADPPIAAVHYRLRNPEGEIESVQVRVDWPANHVEGVSVGGPGAHTFEVWLEDATGAEGPTADIKLRFDSQRPAGVAPVRADGWIGRTELPYAIRVTHPTDPQPVSGIRGYAISVDRAPATSPCLGSYLCTDAETDLRGGIADDALVVDELPEGTSYIHALAISGSQVRSIAPGNTPIRVDRTDPVTTISGLPEGWTNRSVGLEATATDYLSGMGPTTGGAPFTAIRVDVAPPIVAPGDAVTATVVAAGVHTISYYARDAAGNVNDGADSNGHENPAPTTVPLRIDREPPAVVFAGSADPADPELIEARVSDPLSGPDPSRGEIAVRVAGSTDPYQELPTFGAGETLLGRWRSEDYPIGQYEFRVTGYDKAGNATSTTRRANGAAMVLPNPLKARASLIAGFGEGLDLLPRRTVQHGSNAMFAGRLTMSSDAPPGGRTLTVIERFDPGAAEQRRARTVITDDEGRFGLRLGAGPSREVFAVFGGTSTAAGTSSRPLRLGVRAAISLRTSSPTAVVGGRPIVFRGALAASPGELPRGARPSSSNSAPPACPGASSARSRRTAGAASTTPTASATTTAAVCASGSVPSSRRSPSGHTSPVARDQSRCEVSKHDRPGQMPGPERCCRSSKRCCGKACC